MLKAEALNELLAETVREYTRKSEARGRVEYATALVELATMCFCTVGAALSRRDAVILAARMQADIVSLYEREVPDATH